MWPLVLLLLTAAPDGGLAPEAPSATLSCRSVKDCWVDDRTPIRRPKKFRHKRFRPCRDGEAAPACKEGVCAVVHYKC